MPIEPLFLIIGGLAGGVLSFTLDIRDNNGLIKSCFKAVEYFDAKIFSNSEASSFHRSRLNESNSLAKDRV